MSAGGTRRIVTIVMVLLLSGTNPIAAETLPRPRIEYRADLRVEGGGLVLSGPVAYAVDKERRALKLHGTHVAAKVIIIRRDKNAVWVLDTERKSYYGVPLSSESADTVSFLSASLTEKTKVGTETIDGIEATKYRVRFAGGNGTGLVAHMWVSVEDILLRVVGETSYEGRPSSVRMMLTNLKIGPPPAELFEVPTDFAQVPASHPTLGVMAPPPR